MKRRYIFLAAIVAIAVTSIFFLAAGVHAATAGTTIPASNPFPWAWITTRAAGVTSYILLGLLSVTGMFLTTGILFRIMSPATAWSLHRAIGSVLLFSVLLHVGALLFDTYIGLHLKDLLIPFISTYKPLYMGLGIIGFYLLLLVLATSLYTMTRHAKFWRFVHAFSFPMFALIFLHSFFLGTDSKTWWMHSIYWGSAILVGLAVFYRLMWKYRSLDATAG